MQSFPTKPRPITSKAAFSLVEMLVVIAIISILMTAGSIGLSGMGGKGVTSGVASAESLFDEARTTAVSRNLRACVLVAKKLNNNSANDLQRIVVAYQETNADGTPVVTDPNIAPNWVLSSRGTVLPDKTFFSMNLSKTSTGDAVPTVTLSNVKSSYQGDYYIYEFNAQGICKNPGMSFVIGTGTRDTSKPATVQPPKVVGSNKSDFGGFVVWRNGRTSVFRSPDQISTSLPNSGGTF